MISSIFDIMKLYRKEKENNNEVLRNIVGDYTIDSCYTIDAGYETAIWFKGNPMIIVETYNSYKKCKKCHKKWCDFCKTNPKSAFDVHLGEEVEF